MERNKIITVFGATGAQGGGLVRAILADSNSEFKVRAVTRDANSAKAKALAQLGAEVVVADIDDVDSIKKALDGAYGAYFVTFFWEHFSAEKEIQEVINFIQAAKEINLQHIIWSTLEDTRNWVPLDDNRMPTLQGKYKVPHFDGKGAADKLFVETDLAVTFLRTSFYWDNFIYFGMGPKKGDDGKYYIVFPMDDKKLAGMAAEDIGKCAYGIFKKGKAVIGKTIGVVGEKLNGNEMAAKFSSALNKNVTYNNVSPDTFRNFGFPGADDLGNMFQFKRDFNEDFNGNRNEDFSKELNPELQSFDKWLSLNVSRIPLD
ncbi:NmrA/HSCARG family protein [Flavobacterium cellulosilyticum]|uniref:NmrA/HSCARG family protein n=1 Tax=Flavobacterium cellulosilyticum TaxID=2541731 RepID=A0A4R5CG91_9FLAO|nr:NmrA/HSCARG family protein [Flavobacterium cellulosilyticum]TDD98685.1 NmrA/HSCARG family protein [Flavobacterium cellulosilyticum]